MKERWQYKKLGEIATYVNGFPFKPSDWVTEGRPIIRIQNLTDNTASFHRCNRKDIPEKYKIRKGDVLISWSATLGVFEWRREDALLNQHIFKVVFDKDNINKNYFKYAVKSSLGEMSKHTNGATMRHIRKGDFDNIKIPVPPLSEQQRIVSYLDSAFAKIDAVAKNAEASLKEAKALFQSALAKMMEPKEGWEEVNLVKELALKSGVYLPSKEQSGGSIPVYGGNGIAGYHNKGNLDGEHIIIGRVGALCGNVHLTNGKIWVTDNAFVATGIDDSWNKIFLLYQLTTIDLNKYATKAVQPVISNKSLRDISLYKPSLEIQNEISLTLDTLKSKVDQLQSNLSRTLTECAALKQSILRQTFE